MSRYKRKPKQSQTVHQASRVNDQTVQAKETQGKRVQSKSQQYSQLVFSQIQQSLKEHNTEQDKKVLKRYRSLCKRSGGLLRTVGLIQFLSYLAAKSSKESEIHHQFLLDQLAYELNDIQVLKVNNSDELIQAVMKQNLPDYMNTTMQILKLLQWHKRIADILIQGGDE